MISLKNETLKLKFQNGDAVIISNRHNIITFTKTPPKLKEALSIAIEDARTGHIQDSNILKVVTNTDTKTIFFVNGGIITIPLDEKEDTYFKTLGVAIKNMED